MTAGLLYLALTLPLSLVVRRAERGGWRKVIELKNVHKHFGQLHVLKGITSTVDQGEVVVIIGPSGSGKSTLLRCINYLEEPTKGEIIIDGIKLNHSATNINRVRQEVGMVFQSFNLFPHMTVMDNITLAPKKK